MKKVPFPAWQVRPMETGVQILCVQVLELFPETRIAYVAYGRGLSGRMNVPYAELASSTGTAMKLAAAVLAKIEPLPVSSEKSAVVVPLAGGEAG